MAKWLVFIGLLVGSSTVAANPWEQIDAPIAGVSQSIGSYANGCLQGAKALPKSGVGYQVLRPERKRFYGHPEMVSFLTELGNKAASLELPNFLVADIAMPGGGKFSSGHASHQTGLDADIWLRMPISLLSDNELAKPSAISVVHTDSFTLNKTNWRESQGNLIQLAASDDRVARIFVHPVIKKQLCDMDWKERTWLQKVRPWWGHHYHFHVRLKCPVGSGLCLDQRVPPAGEGCGSELYSWWPKPEDKKPVKTTKPPKEKIKPAACLALLNG